MSQPSGPVHREFMELLTELFGDLAMPGASEEEGPTRPVEPVHPAAAGTG